jgi:hypothetical protein
MLDPTRETPIIPIASFFARRAAAADSATTKWTPGGGYGYAPPAPPPVEITVIPMPPTLTDIGVVVSPTRAVMVAGPGADLDDAHRVQPIWTPSQARLVAERLIAAARAAECPKCCHHLREAVIEVPPPVCAACESGAAGE